MPSICCPEDLHSARQFIHTKGSRWLLPMAPHCGLNSSTSNAFQPLPSGPICHSLPLPRASPAGCQAGPSLCQEDTTPVPMVFCLLTLLTPCPISVYSLIHWACSFNINGMVELWSFYLPVVRLAWSVCLSVSLFICKAEIMREPISGSPHEDSAS